MISALTIGNLSAHEYIFPKNGQSAEQQQKDEYACYSWAVSQTGFDPTKVQAAAPVAAPVQQEPQGPSTAGSTVGGAAAGATIAAIGGHDTGNGAAKGAAIGFLAGRIRHREEAAHEQAEEQQAEQKAAQAQKASNAQVTDYNKARNVCLEAKGYTVSN